MIRPPPGVRSASELAALARPALLQVIGFAARTIRRTTCPFDGEDARTLLDLYVDVDTDRCAAAEALATVERLIRDQENVIPAAFSARTKLVELVAAHEREDQEALYETEVAE